MLWQLPDNFRCDLARREQALQGLPHGRHAFEFRHESWFRDDLYELLRKHGVALVVGDDPRRPFQTREITTDFTLVRFHRGHDGRRHGRYGRSELEPWAEWLRGLPDGCDAWAYFNNDWSGYALRDAGALRELLA